MVRVSDDKLPGDSFALSIEKVWEVIKDQRDLNLPAHKVWTALQSSCMVSAVAVQCVC